MSHAQSTPTDAPELVELSRAKSEEPEPDPQPIPEPEPKRKRNEEAKKESEGDSDSDSEPQMPKPEDMFKVAIVSAGEKFVMFNVRARLEMRHLKKRYADYVNGQGDDLRYIFGGKRVNDDDTVISLKMTKRDNIIEVYKMQIGG